MDGRDEASVWSGEPPQLSERELLEWAASFSPRAEAELRRLKWAEAEAKAKARQDRELLEFVAAITGKPEHQRELHALLKKEVEERVARERQQLPTEAGRAQEAWNPNQARVPAGSPQGGEWSKSGGVGGSAGALPSRIGLMTQYNRGFADHTSEPATTGTAAAMAQFAGDHAPVHLAAAARARAGHHWVPHAVFDALSHLMDENALKIFELGTESTGVYNHAFDTWKGVTHDRYIKNLSEY